MRRMELATSLDDVLKAVRDGLGVERSERMKGRSASGARLLAMRSLKEEAGSDFNSVGGK